MKTFHSVLTGVGLTALLSISVTANAATTEGAASHDRGRYLVAISGCNDCHTPSYPEKGGQVPATEWLVGSPVGFQGPWGTTYPSNLRLYVQSLTETQWIARARQPMRPPMPWFSLAAMSDSDLSSIYRFVRDLGAKGAPAPAYVEPGKPVTTPYVEMLPKNLPVPDQAAR